VYDNVTYIVAAIALRDGPDGREVLLMREAKEKCRGKWYMPAGHVEPGETIEVIGNWALAMEWRHFAFAGGSAPGTP
jgi:8-oxo-dGTP pyrophosphatase MutT (NUDIX family)